jgi:hypothetical protein
VSLSVRHLFVEFRYNLGSGPVALRSRAPIALGRRVRVVAKRYLWDGMLSVEGQEDVSGKSDGALKSLDWTQNLFVGFVATDESRVYDNIGISSGLVGCVHAFRIGRKDIDLSSRDSKDVLRVVNTRECVPRDPCLDVECGNGGTCLADEHLLYRCVCDARFTGRHCETETTSACQSNPCLEGASCVDVEGDGFVCKCPKGRTGRLCDDCKCHHSHRFRRSTISLFPVIQREMSSVRVPDFWGSSFLRLPPLQGVGHAFTIEGESRSRELCLDQFTDSFADSLVPLARHSRPSLVLRTTIGRLSGAQY